MVSFDADEGEKDGFLLILQSVFAYLCLYLRFSVLLFVLYLMLYMGFALA